MTTTPSPAIPRSANFGVKSPPDWVDLTDKEPGVWVNQYGTLELDVTRMTPSHKYAVVSNGQPMWVQFITDGGRRKLKFSVRTVQEQPVVKS